MNKNLIINGWLELPDTQAQKEYTIELSWITTRLDNRPYRVAPDNTIQTNSCTYMAGGCTSAEWLDENSKCDNPNKNIYYVAEIKTANNKVYQLIFTYKGKLTFPAHSDHIIKANGIYIIIIEIESKHYPLKSLKYSIIYAADNIPFKWLKSFQCLMDNTLLKLIK